MAEEIVRKCDYPIRGAAHGVRVPDDKSTELRIGDTEYELDVCAEHLEMLRKRIETFLEIARPVRTRVGNSTRRTLGIKGGKPFTTKQVREWLVAQGREVPPSGRLPNDLIAEYEAAQGKIPASN